MSSPSPSPAGRPVRRSHWLVATTEYAGVTAYTGGIGRHYASLVPALTRIGVAVDLVVFSDDDSVPAAPDVASFSHRSTTGTSRTRLLGLRSGLLREHYDPDRHDVVFLPEWSALGAALPSTTPLLTNLATGTRLANEISGIRLRDLPRELQLPVALQARREARQMRRSAGLIAISTAMLARTRSMYRGLPPARVVRNCIDVAHVRSCAVDAPPPRGWPDDGAPVVLFLGRSERRKGVADAVAAFAHILSRRPDAHLVLAGAGGDARYEPTRAELLAMLPDAARARVTWLGHVPGDDLYGAIRAADVVLCPSRWEGFGNVALEVKTIGTPLIVTSGSGFDDFCTDGIDCQMVPPAAPEQLAEAVLRALGEPEWARLLAARGEAQVDRFAPDPVAADLLLAADSLLDGRERGLR